KPRMISERVAVVMCLKTRLAGITLPAGPLVKRGPPGTARRARRPDRVTAWSVAALVLERDPQPHAVAGDRPVLDRDVLTDHLRDAQVTDRLGRRLDRVLRRGGPGFAADADDLGDAVDAVRCHPAPFGRG